MNLDKNVNPLLKYKMEVNLDSKTVQLNLNNISKFFTNVYVLSPFKNNSYLDELSSRYIDKSTLKNLSTKLVLHETSIKIIGNFNHSHNIVLCNSIDFESFNHFGYEMKEKILILPIFDVSYINITKYLKLFEGSNTFIDLYKLLVVNQHFNTNSVMPYNSHINLTKIIKNLQETDYWTKKYNCLLNITQVFNFRKLRFSNLSKIKDPIIKELFNEIKEVDANYLTMIENDKKFIDASSAIKNSGYKLYKIAQKTEITKDDINIIFNNLNETQKYFLFSNLLVSKKYCHLVLNNESILINMKSVINYFSNLYRYLFGYAWLRFYLEECIKKTWIKKDDEFIFDINTASHLPVFPFTLDDPKSNPYVTILIDDKSINKNLGGFRFYNTTDNKLNNQGITNLEGFRCRMNLFISGNSSNDVFKNLDWNIYGFAVSGSIMTACLQKKHPLVNLFSGKNNYGECSEFDIEYSRYFNEYYAEADIDIMVKSVHPIEFMNKVKVIYDKIVINICDFNPQNAEPNHIKMKTIQTVFFFVNDEFINNYIVCDDMSLNYIKTNLENEKVIDKFKPFIHIKIEEYYQNIFSDFNIDKVKTKHPELFDDNEIVYQIHMKKQNMSNDRDSTIDNVGINISYKVKISSTHIQRDLELFPIFGDDFFAVVSKFHMPCVRSYYDGENVYLTPSCITAHLTYMNIDYKYFAGSKDPIEIILKYRMRGFGTFLNKKEISRTIKYVSQVQFWNNLHNITTDVNSINQFLGHTDFSDKLHHPRMYNQDLFSDKAPYVNLIDGYNNIPENLLIPINTTNQFEYINNKFKSFNDLLTSKMRTIGKTGYVNKLRLWVIDSIYNTGKYEFFTDKSNNEEDSKNYSSSGLSNNVESNINSTNTIDEWADQHWNELI